MWGATRALASAKHLAGSVRSLCTTVSPVVSRAAKCSDAPVMTPTTQDTLALVENTLGPLSLSPMVPEPQPVVLVVSGPSGVGKDSVVEKLRELRPDMHFVVTATSRPKREGETHGVDYLFVDKPQFEQWIADDALLEHALVYGQYKGIPRQQVSDALARGSDVVLRLDVQGAATMRTLLPGVVSVFIVAQSESELVTRLVERKTDAGEALLRRVGTMQAECARMGEFEYVVVNAEGGLETAARKLSAIVEAERARTGRPPATVADV